MFLVNGQSTHSIALTDRALHYGDGVFETVAIIGKRPIHWDAHIQRLLKGCERLLIPPPDISNLRENVDKLLNFSQEHKAVLKIIYTRGSGGRGYQIPIDTYPSQIVALYPWPNYPEAYYVEGINVHICDTRISRNSVLAGIKHLNRLEQVLARAEWKDSTMMQEGLMLDEQSNIIEGTMTNLFVVANDSLITPDLNYSGVAGIIRSIIIDYAKHHNWPCQVKSIKLADLMRAEELFLCNSIIGIWPIRKVVDKQFNVGERTRQLQELIFKDFK